MARDLLPVVSEKTVKIKWLVASEELEQEDERKAVVRKKTVASDQ